ncbi:unnamed protein product [Durusdinium trenchii]|uniref:Epoxide hydrolase n=1 Tax=Durusdinium trenchii TaxID=1381693 RepID=A0ABP0ISB6_9DINO
MYCIRIMCLSGWVGKASRNCDSRYDSNVEEFLKRLYLSTSMATSEIKAFPAQAPRVRDPKRSAGGMLERLPSFNQLPSWLPRAALERFVKAFEASGFRGGVNYYRCLNRNWEKTKAAFEKSGRKIKQPTFFIAGELDMVIRTYGGTEAAESMVSKVCSDLKGCHFIPDCGHWNTQEKPQETSTALIRFLDQTAASEPKGARRSRL